MTLCILSTAWLPEQAIRICTSTVSSTASTLLVSSPVQLSQSAMLSTMTLTFIRLQREAIRAAVCSHSAATATVHSHHLCPSAIWTSSSATMSSSLTLRNSRLRSTSSLPRTTSSSRISWTFPASSRASQLTR